MPFDGKSAREADDRDEDRIMRGSPFDIPRKPRREAERHDSASMAMQAGDVGRFVFMLGGIAAALALVAAVVAA